MARIFLILFRGDLPLFGFEPTTAHHSQSEHLSLPIIMSSPYNPPSSIGFAPRKKNKYDEKGHLLPSAAPTKATRLSGITNGMHSLNIGGPPGRGLPTQAATLRTLRTVAPSKAEDYSLGDLVNVPHVAPSLDPNPQVGPQLIKADDIYISKKRRFAVVVKIYKSRMIVLPVYSCSGNGLDRKPDEYKLTAVSIWNPKNDTTDFKSHLAPLCVNVLGAASMKPGSHMSLTEPLVVDYQCRIQKIDKLTPESTRKMVALYNAAQHLGEKPCAVHDQVFTRDVEYIINPAKAKSPGMVAAPIPPPLKGGSYASRLSAAASTKPK